ncbi:MAG: hydrogenase maturation nickel metallochaperone HypA [Phycisphaeraceae bacterium]|nr:hydrogenase maturation nickel metallochaperone HypA [Phycisphaeraceae bacterium]
MHELSIAWMLLEQVRRHTPGGVTVRRVRVRVGALRGIDADTMGFAWQAATSGTPLQDSQLEVETRDRSDELMLLSVEVEEPGRTPGDEGCR